MKKNGFTLIEILSVIVIISLLLILVTPNILANLNKNKGDVSEAFEQIIIEATDLYIDENPDIYEENVGDVYCISTDTLINAGKLIDPIIDPETGKEISGISVSVTIKDKGRDFKLGQGDCATGNSLGKDDIELIISNITTKGFTVTTNISKEIEIAKYDYTIDDGKTYPEENKGRETRITNLKTGTYKVRVKLTTADGQIIVSNPKEVQLVEIEDIAFTSDPNTEACVPSKTITVINSDSPPSAAQLVPTETLSYYYTLDKSQDESDWTKVTSLTCDGVKCNYELSANKNLTISAKVTDGINFKKATYDVKRISTKNPTIDSANIDYSEKYYAAKITLKGKVSECLEEENISNLDGYCLTKTNVKPNLTDACWAETDSKGVTNPKEGIFGRDNGQYYAWVKDESGNISDVGYPVKVNWTKTPTCSIKVTGTLGNNSWYRSNVQLSLTIDSKGKTVRTKKISHTSITANGQTNVTGSVSTGGKTVKCSKTVKVDKKAPTCTVSAYATNVVKPSVTFSCTDANSGCVVKSTKKTTTKTATLSYTCKDKAGNTATASKKVVKANKYKNTGGKCSLTGTKVRQYQYKPSCWWTVDGYNECLTTYLQKYYSDGNKLYPCFYGGYTFRACPIHGDGDTRVNDSDCPNYNLKSNWNGKGC